MFENAVSHLIGVVRANFPAVSGTVLVCTVLFFLRIIQIFQYIWIESIFYLEVVGIDYSFQKKKRKVFV